MGGDGNVPEWPKVAHFGGLDATECIQMRRFRHFCKRKITCLEEEGVATDEPDGTGEAGAGAGEGATRLYSERPSARAGQVVAVGNARVPWNSP